MDILAKPAQLSFAGNPMRYLLSDESGITPPERSVIEISFTDIDTTPDHAIEVDFLNATRNFTLKAEPTEEDELPAASVEMSPALWAQEVYEYLLNDSQIGEFYDIEIAGAVITLTARTGDSDYDWTAGTSTIVGMTIATTTPGSSGSTSSVEGVRCQVWKNGTELIGEDYKQLNSDNEVQFDVQEYLWAYLLMAPAPRFKLSKPGFWHHVYYDYLMKYRTVFCDKVAGAFLPRTYTDPFHIFCYALPGGLSRADLVANNYDEVDYFGLAATKKKFLTWSPPSRITDEAETHSLFFAFQDPVHTKYTLKCIIVTTEAMLEPVAITTEQTIIPWTVVEFLVGYGQLGLAGRTAQEVVSWQVYLVDESDNVISDVREFVLDKAYRENTRYFRFRNSWGAYDSLRCTGNFDAIVEHEREKVAYEGEETETSYNAPGAHTMVSELQSFKANSGWVTRDFLEFLRDFMLSSDTYEVDGDRLLKVLVTSKKTTLFKDKVYNYNLAFEYERGYSDFFFHGLE